MQKVNKTSIYECKLEAVGERPTSGKPMAQIARVLCLTKIFRCRFLFILLSQACVGAPTSSQACCSPLAKPRLNRSPHDKRTRVVRQRKESCRTHTRVA
jgi:hypothetical protein